MARTLFISSDEKDELVKQLAVILFPLPPELAPPAFAAASSRSRAETLSEQPSPSASRRGFVSLNFRILWLVKKITHELESECTTKVHPAWKRIVGWVGATAVAIQ